MMAKKQDGARVSFDDINPVIDRRAVIEPIEDAHEAHAEGVVRQVAEALGVADTLTETDIRRPIGSLAEAIDRAAEFTPDEVERLKAGGHAFRGGFRGSLDLGKSIGVHGRLEPAESDGLRRIFLALNRSNARLKDGRHVTTAIDTVRWLMEDATRQIEERAGA